MGLNNYNKLAGVSYRRVTRGILIQITCIVFLQLDLRKGPSLRASQVSGQRSQP